MENKQKKSLILCSILTVVVGVIIGLLIGYIRIWMISLMYLALVITTVLFVVGVVKKIEWLSKFMVTTFYVAIFALLVFGAVMWSGMYEQFYNESGELDANAIQSSIEGKKGSAWIFMALSFLQVTLIPIPSTVTTFIGIALFGKANGFIYSLIGQVTGSMFAFFLGRKFGAKLIIWIVGDDAYYKYHALIKGRDKIILIFMFMFPFFPDDLLCMFAGLTTFTALAFFIIILLTRIFTIGYTVLGVGFLEVIKDLGAWTYVIYAVVGIIVIGLLYYVWHKGDKLEEKMLAFIEKIIPEKYRHKFIAEIDEEQISKRLNSVNAPFSNDNTVNNDKSDEKNDLKTIKSDNISDDKNNTSNGDTSCSCNENDIKIEKNAKTNKK
ncbi:MAG: VTT domain-containing protein [Clostridia bacterium]